MEAINSNVLNGVGKKMRSSYLAGHVTEKEVMSAYLRNKKEAEAFKPIGWVLKDFMQELERTHNPLMRNKLTQLIDECKEKTRHSENQNILSLKKLEFYRQHALGMGLRKVLRKLRKMASLDVDARILFMLLETEFANLTAKRKSHVKELIYERKNILLHRVSDFLYENGWTCGINYHTGKNASYIVYVYLPNKVQLSWHCNDYRIMYSYDEINCTWDGEACTTIEKILDYVHNKFKIGDQLVKYKDVANN